ncbi:hypothetical protein [Christiangramia aquimixticola]|uniref:hypothetical protein n=1 Tax=Christiangramia aquimixticola TaxID=1697558 RepID=UPI003AA89557
MYKLSNSIILKTIYLVLAYLVIFVIETFELALILTFLPYLINSIVSYLKFDKSTANKNQIILSKSNFDFLNLVFIAIIIAFCISDINIYTGILLLLALVQIFLEYTVSKRTVLFIDKNGIDEFGKDKHRDLKDITSLEIYPNNIEFRFKEYEILQINQHELVRPNWEDFVKKITDIKTYAKKA